MKLREFRALIHVKGQHTPMQPIIYKRIVPTKKEFKKIAEEAGFTPLKVIIWEVK